mmetsp:Transcript_5530/g.12069  ORF Transcript_5530/g.12069 Transcript_5530/m.12069 type:complete len:264 (+) Transcript_5530:527-1318(+)
MLSLLALALACRFSRLRSFSILFLSFFDRLRSFFGGSVSPLPSLFPPSTSSAFAMEELRLPTTINAKGATLSPLGLATAVDSAPRRCSSAASHLRLVSLDPVLPDLAAALATASGTCASISFESLTSLWCFSLRSSVSTKPPIRPLRSAITAAAMADPNWDRDATVWGWSGPSSERRMRWASSKYSMADSLSCIRSRADMCFELLDATLSFRSCSRSTSSSLLMPLLLSPPAVLSSSTSSPSAASLSNTLPLSSMPRLLSAAA